MGRALGLLLLVGCVAAAVAARPSPAWAQEAPGERVAGRLERGKQRFAELEYRAAIRELRPLRTDAAASRAQRLSALEIVGISHLILGEEALAIEAFEELLAIDPGYLLQHDDGSPKIRTFFDGVRQRYVPGARRSGEAELEHVAPAGATAARRIELEARVVRGAAAVKEMLLFWRRRGAAPYAEAPMHRVGDGRWRGGFTPPASKTAYPVDYYMEARDVARGALGRVGGPDSPLGLEIAAGSASAGPWYGRWYVIAGGVVAVGLVTGIVVVAAGGDTPDGSLEPGRVTLTP